MTTHYIDFTVISDVQTSEAQILGILYGRLHLALVRQHVSDIGVSFPHYSNNPRAIGNVLRLHGESVALQRLMNVDWLKGVRDHVRMTEITPAPVDAEHRTVSRKQFKTNAERLRRRRIRRTGESAEQVAKAIPSTMERKPDLPFIHLRSQSTGQGFHLFIALGPLQSKSVPGTFNSYGLGGPATIPWF